MKPKILISVILLFLIMPFRVDAQKENRSFDISVDPIAFFLNGVSVHGGYQTNGWHFDLEGFNLEVPASLHGNEGFESSQWGLELKVDRYFKGITDGFFVSAGGGISNLQVEHQESGAVRKHMEYSGGIRSGYRWNTGLGNLYVTPLAGLEFTFNPRDLEIYGDTYENGGLQPYATANIGWWF